MSLPPGMPAAAAPPAAAPPSDTLPPACAAAANAQITQLLHAAGAGQPGAADALVERLYHELRALARSRLRHSGHLTLMDTTALVHESWLRLQSGLQPADGHAPVDGAVGSPPVVGAVGSPPVDGAIGSPPVDGAIGSPPVDGAIGSPPAEGAPAAAPALRFADRRHFLAYAARAMHSVVIDLVRSRQASRHGGDVVHLTLDATLADRLDGSAGAHILQVHEALQQLAALDARLASVVEMRFFGGLDDAEIAAALGVAERTVQRDWHKARLLLAQWLR